jgi:hypothetical protein
MSPRSSESVAAGIDKGVEVSVGSGVWVEVEVGKTVAVGFGAEAILHATIFNIARTKMNFRSIFPPTRIGKP